MPFIKKVPDDVEVSVSSDVTDLEMLLRLLDNPNVQLSREADKTTAEVGEVIYFLRTFKGNKVIAKVDTEETVIICEEGKDLPSEITLNDFCLLCGRDILHTIFDKSSGKLLAMNAFPTPFGLYRDTEKDCNVVVMQLCLNSEELPELPSEYKYVPVEESKLPEFLKSKFKHTKE